MRNPLFFFIIVFVIDLVLKSAKNKKKVEQARRTRTSEIKPAVPKNRSIMQTIRDEIEKEVQKDNKKRMVKQPVYKEGPQIVHKNSAEESFRQDILKGIIFAEIISEPKSIKNQQKSM